jgi:tetratricopeptide (TPR) repeat protein
MDQTKYPTTAAIELPSRRTGRLPYTHMVQNFRLIWLDGSIDDTNNEDYRNSISKLRQVVNTVDTFTDVDVCMDIISGITEEKVFIIISGAVGQKTVPIVHDMAHVNSIYIFCGNKSRHEQWAQQWSKVKGVFTDITPICEALKQATQDCDHNLVANSFVKASDAASSENLDLLDSSFMYTQTVKEILLTNDFEPIHFNEFLRYCREQFAGNTVDLKSVDKLEKEYRHHQPIWCYTSDCFFYSVLNSALRTMEVDLIVKVGFFVRDLHEHIIALHAEQYGGQSHSASFIVYRGQGLSQIDFDQLRKTQDELLFFNNFVSTIQNCNVCLDFAKRTTETSNLVSILFVMTIDPSIHSIPFANIADGGADPTVEKILFSMPSVFRIEKMNSIGEDNRLWQIDLTLTSDNDKDLYAPTKRMREETFPDVEGWYRLGQLLFKRSQLNKAEQVYQVLSEQASSDREKASIYHYLGIAKDDQGEYKETIRLYEKALDIHQKSLSPNHLDLTTSYNNIDLAYFEMADYSRALSLYEKALEIDQRALPPNHPNLATSYNNIGVVYSKSGKFWKVLLLHQKAFDTGQHSLPADHFRLQG